MKRLLYAGIVIVSFSFFPHSLERIHTLGYDFPIYYAAGRHVFLPGYVYSHSLWVFFWPLSWFTMDTAFAIWYAVSVLCWLSFAKKFPVLAILGAYPMLLALELGQITPMLAWLCLTPLGSICAGIWKPYLFGFTLIHAGRAATRLHRERGRHLGENLLQSQSTLTDSTVRND